MMRMMRMSRAQNYTFDVNGGESNSLTIDTGKSDVHRADLNITAGNSDIYVDGTPSYSGTVDHWVNGDNFDVSYGLSTGKGHLTSEVGTHKEVIGFWYGGKFYTKGSEELNDLFGGNYNIKFEPGDLTVLDWPGDVPTPDPGEHWNFLFDDNPWDRNRDFRERKAEVHFVAGGMTL